MNRDPDGERKVRTPQSSVPDNVREPGVKVGRRPVPQKTYRRRKAVRVKRCGKSAPPVQQWAGHGKPHTEQDQIGEDSRQNRETCRLGTSLVRREARRYLVQAQPVPGETSG